MKSLSRVIGKASSKEHRQNAGIPWGDGQGPRGHISISRSKKNIDRSGEIYKIYVWNSLTIEDKRGLEIDLVNTMNTKPVKKKKLV